MAEVRIIIWPNYFADPATAPQRATIDTAALMPHAEIERVENAGHFPWLEFPDAMRASIDRLPLRPENRGQSPVDVAVRFMTDL